MAAIAVDVLGALLASRWQPRRELSRIWLAWLGATGLLAVLLAGTTLWQLLRDGDLLLLAASKLCLLLASQQPRGRDESSPHRRWNGATRWLQAWGRLSYEIYLSHMVVVFAVVRVYRTVGGDPRRGFLWYLLAVPLCWLLGASVERCFSLPCERWLRGRLLRTPTSGANQIPLSAPIG